MTTLDQHLATWRSNEATVERLVEITEEYGWAITCLFYAALHLVEARLVGRVGKVSSHFDRAAVMRTEVELQPVLRFYTRLKQESENHRYRCRLYSAAEVTRLRALLYTPLADHMRNLLGAK